MTHNWKPGDVALVEAGCHANRVVALRTGVPSNMGWACCDSHDGQSTWHWSSDDSGIVTPVRPLLVIDPENRAQVERLRDLTLHVLREQVGDRAVDDRAFTTGDLGNAMQGAIRSLLGPEPEEPTGLGAVARDRDGRTYSRIARSDQPWAEYRGFFTWSDLPRPITVLSEGWQESADE